MEFNLKKFDRRKFLTGNEFKEFVRNAFDKLL